MKKILIVAAIVVVAVGGYQIYKKIKPDDLEHKNPEVSCTYFDMTEIEPEFVNAYIDASGSMKGYFSIQSDGRFISALSNADPDKTMWMDSKFTELKGIPTNQLLTNKFSGGDSRFDLMLASIIQHDSLSISNGISLLFTDGILSASKSETDKNPNYMLQSFDIFKNYIAKAIKDKNVAVSVFALESKYNGVYWNFQNNQETGLEVENRPFYVIALGTPAQMRHFVANNHLGAKKVVAFGIYDKEITKNNSSKNQEGLLGCAGKGWEGATFVGNDFEQELSLPQTVAALGNEYNKKNLVVEFDGQDQTAKLGSCVSIIGENLRIENWNVNDTDKPIITPGEHIFTVKIKKALPEGWDKLYSENDSLIKTDVTEQGKTFALQYLLTGIQEGVEPQEVVIFSSSIKFYK